MDVIAKCRVKTDYEKKDLSELTLKTGEVVDVLKKGKYIWYGRLDGAKGFFPSRVVTEIEEQTFNEMENPLSSSAVTDSDKNVSLNSAEVADSMDSKKVSEAFQEIESTSPLEDKRRSRPRSAGRPPSQVFIKETILQKSESMENSNPTSEDEEEVKQPRPAVVTNTTSTSVSQLVFELKHKPHLKTVSQKDTVSSLTSTFTSTENSTDVPSWKIGLPKKKLSVPGPIQKSACTGVIPWMEEVRKRRQHKLSLKGDDEMLQNIGQEVQASQENNIRQVAVEIKNFVETRATNKVVTEEKRNIQTNSFSSETYSVTSSKTNSTSGTTTINQSYLLTDGVDTNATLAIKNVENDSKESETKMHTSIPRTRTVSNSVAPEVGDSQKCSVSHTDTIAAPVKQPACIKIASDKSEVLESQEGKVAVTVTVDSKTNLDSGSKEISECIKKTFIDEPKLIRAESIESKEMVDNEGNNVEISEIKEKDGEDQKDATFPEIPNPSTESRNKYKENFANSVKQLLTDIERFEINSKVRLSEIHKDIEKVEKAVDQQFQEIITFAEATKLKLFALIETKED